MITDQAAPATGLIGAAPSISALAARPREEQPMLPFDPVEPETLDLPLAALPPDTELAGPDPAPALVESIRVAGILQPVVLARRAAKGEVRAAFVVMAGRRRIKAARLVKLPSIPARIYPEGWVNPATVTVMENALRSANDVAMIEALEKLLTGNPEGEVLKIPGVTKPLLSRVRKLTSLLPELLGALKDGSMSIGTAFRAVTLERERQQQLVTVLHDTGKVTGDDVYEASRAQAAEAAASLSPNLFNRPGYVDEDGEGDGNGGEWEGEGAATPGAELIEAKAAVELLGSPASLHTNSPEGLREVLNALFFRLWPPGEEGPVEGWEDWALAAAAFVNSFLTDEQRKARFRTVVAELEGTKTGVKKPETEE